jgi:glycosyltransferase involved in cell wall biosynthesis
VIDLDDLQSRRIELLLNDRLPLSPGYLTEKLPPFFKLLISSLSRWILLYEHATLRRTEIEALGVADAVVLVSTEDGGILRKAVDPTLAARIQTIQPSFASPVIDPRPFDRVRRFIFVGTDGLTQNRLTIDYLIGLWRERRPATPLVIFGKQSRNTSLPEGVTAAGYVESLSEIYDDQSVLLTPSFIRGGIKTKVLEAFAHRVPVVGNDCTFEAMDFPDYPFSLDSEESLLELIENPDNFTSAFRSAADQGFARVRENYSPKVFAERWRAALGLPSKEVEVAH